MIADPALTRAVDEFVKQWLRFDLVLNAVKDRTVYPQFTPELAVAMTEETRRVWSLTSSGTIATSWTSSRATPMFLNSDLAALYDLPAPANGVHRVPVSPPDSDRAGILGQATFLRSTSKPGKTSPTVRGYSIREQFLCNEIPDPPPGTNSNSAAIRAAKPRPTASGCRST